MKKYIVLFCMLLPFFAEAAVLFLFMGSRSDILQDTIAVNETVKTVEAGWDDFVRKTITEKTQTALDYAVLDESGRVLFKTKENISGSIHAAVQHRDTVLDVSPNGRIAGKLIIYNTSEKEFASQRREAAVLFAVLLFVQALMLAVFAIYFDYKFPNLPCFYSTADWETCI